MWRILSFQSASAASAFDLDSATYRSSIEDDDAQQLMPTIKSAAITRGQYSPTIVGTMREVDKLAVTVRILAADWRTARRNLAAACANDEQDPGTLTAADENGTQWTLQARVTNLVRTKFANTYRLLLDVPDLIWRKAATSDVWNITASGQTTTITNTGNRKMRPVIRFEPSTVKSDGFLYRHWVPVRNPNTDRGMTLWPLDLTDGGLDTRPWVKDPANYMQINNGAGITNSQTTIPYDTLTEGTAGIIGTYGIGYIDDGVNQEQIMWTGRTGTTSGNLTGVTRGIGGTTKRAFADNVKIHLSYMKADASDLRCHRNDTEQNMWVEAPNTAATRMWIVASEPAGISMTLGAAISGVGTIDLMTMQATTSNLQALSALPPEGVVRINNEAFHYTSVEAGRFRLNIDLRSINDTAAAAHSIGDAVYFLPNDYWLYSGNGSLAAQNTNNARKPLLTLSTSDNDTRVQTEFWDVTGLRTNKWTPATVKSIYPTYLKASQYYTGNEGVEGTDPATDAGMLMRSLFRNGLWRFEDGMITWTLYEPAGIATVTSWSYSKYRTGQSWPTYARLEKSKDGLTWENVSAVTTPTSASSWATTTATPGALGSGYYFLRTLFQGQQVAGALSGVGYVSALETNAITYTTAAPLVPEIMARKENSYEHSFTFRNSTNGYYFQLALTCPFDAVVEVDCDNKIIRTLGDNKKRRASLLVPNSQRDWMLLNPGDNTLEHTESGVTGLKATIIHADQLAG